MNYGGVEIAFTIVIDKEGQGNFSTVQAALDAIDDYNKRKDGLGLKLTRGYMCKL